MKCSLNDRVFLFSLILGTLCTAFVVYMVYTFQNGFLTKIVVLFCLLIILSSQGLY